jgi:hypothetical protein
MDSYLNRVLRYDVEEGPVNSPGVLIPKASSCTVALYHSNETAIFAGANCRKHDKQLTFIVHAELVFN